MAQEIKGFAEHFDGFVRHLRLAAVTFVVIIGIGTGFAFSLPDVYKARGYILIEEPSIPEEIIRSTVTSYAASQLTILNEKILTIPTMIGLVEKFDLYPSKRRDTAVELLASDARMAVSVEIQTRESVTSGGMPGMRAVGFTVGFEDEDPAKALAVTEDLVTRYLEQNLKLRSEQTTETSDFLKEEVASLEEEIGELEGGLARFKEEHADTLPSLNALNMNMMTRIDGQLLQLEGELQVIEQTRISISAQLATLNPSIPVMLADGSFALSPIDQLKQLQSQLSIYEGRYSDDHPDVIAARRDIEGLRQRFGIDADLVLLDEDIVSAKADLAKAQEKYSPEHPDVMRLKRRLEELERMRVTESEKRLEGQVEPDNPAYIQLQSSLAVLDAEEQNLRDKIAELYADMADYEQRLMETPQVEKELAALQRTLSSTSNRYWVMRDKQFAAEMGETLETESKGEEMILLEPPRLPLLPFKPNRGAIITLAFLFAMVAGIGITQLVDSIDKSIRNSAAILAIQGVPPLVEVPYIFSQQELMQAAKVRKFALASAAPAILILVLIMHFTVLPLDVLWYALASRIGL